MITESFHDYKGYVIRLRAKTNNGFWYAIIKRVPNASSPDGIKNIYLRELGFNFIRPEDLLQKAKSYIDQHEKNLIDKLTRILTNGTRRENSPSQLEYYWQERSSTGAQLG